MFRTIHEGEAIYPCPIIMLGKSVESSGRIGFYLYFRSPFRVHSEYYDFKTWDTTEGYGYNATMIKFRKCADRKWRFSKTTAFCPEHLLEGDASE